MGAGGHEWMLEVTNGRWRSCSPGWRLFLCVGVAEGGALGRGHVSERACTDVQDREPAACLECIGDMVICKHIFTQASVVLPYRWQGVGGTLRAFCRLVQDGSFGIPYNLALPLVVTCGSDVMMGRVCEIPCHAVCTDMHGARADRAASLERCEDDSQLCWQECAVCILTTDNGQYGLNSLRDHAGSAQAQGQQL